MNKEERWILEEKYNGAQNSEFVADCQRLANGEPLAYIIGWQPFLGLKIFLDSRPLIPRAETEWWTEKMLHKNKNFCRFLDLCAGSGAIGCAALASSPNSQVYFIEIDRKHKETILKNIRKNNLDESRAHIYIGNLFEPLGDTKFDVIAANPPYIPNDRKLPESVADYEPSNALYAGVDGLNFIRIIAEKLPDYLNKDGVAWIECDTSHIKEARHLFINKGMLADLQNDQYGIPRVIVVSFH